MKRKITPTLLVVLIVLINLSILTVLFVRLALSARTTKKSGFDEWNPEDSFLVDKQFLEKDFLTDYPYRDGGFRWYCKKGFFFSLWGGIPYFGVVTKAERSFVWLTYDDEETYRDAKQSRIDSEKNAGDHSLDGTVAFGYTFYINDDFRNWRGSQYPYYFTAFGYNDEAQTLVFLGFFGSGKKQKKYVELAKTDFSAFLAHYYGEWFDWE